MQCSIREKLCFAGMQLCVHQYFGYRLTHTESTLNFSLLVGKCVCVWVCLCLCKERSVLHTKRKSKKYKENHKRLSMHMLFWVEKTPYHFLFHLSEKSIKSFCKSKLFIILLFLFNSSGDFQLLKIAP